MRKPNRVSGIFFIKVAERGLLRAGAKLRRAKETMSPQDFLVHSRRSEDGRGNLLRLSRERAGWQSLKLFGASTGSR